MGECVEIVYDLEYEKGLSKGSLLNYSTDGRCLIYQIRKYTIHKLSTDVVLSPVEKILLARAHKVAAWLDEGVTSLVVSNGPGSKFEDLVTLGWETAARILWILRDTSTFYPDGSITLHFRRVDIQCAYCSSSSSLIDGLYDCTECDVDIPADAELTFEGPGLSSGNTHRLVPVAGIECHQCIGFPFSRVRIYCNSCSVETNSASEKYQVKITRSRLIKEMFGEEIEELVKVERGCIGKD